MAKRATEKLAVMTFPRRVRAIKGNDYNYRITSQLCKKLSISCLKYAVAQSLRNAFLQNFDSLGISLLIGLYVGLFFFNVEAMQRCLDRKWHISDRLDPRTYEQEPRQNPQSGCDWHREVLQVSDLLRVRHCFIVFDNLFKISSKCFDKYTSFTLI